MVQAYRVEPIREGKTWGTGQEVFRLTVSTVRKQ